MNSVMTCMAAGLVATTALAFATAGADKPKKTKFIDPANMDLSVKPGDKMFKPKEQRINIW